MTNEKNNFELNRFSGSGKPGFEPFAQNGLFYFFVNDPGGQPVLFSRACSTAQERDNRMRMVSEIIHHPELYEVKEEKGVFFLSVRTTNRREIARSPAYSTREEADEHLRRLLDVMPAKSGKTTTSPRIRNSAPTIEAGTSEIPRHYFDLKFYPDGRGVVQYPLTGEALCFLGLDEEAIIGFVRSKITPSPVKTRARVVSSPSTKTAKKKNELKISLPFSTISTEELARTRKIEVGIGVDNQDAEAIRSAFFFLKALKNGQTFPLNECPVNSHTKTQDNALAYVALPVLETGLYRLVAARENTSNPFTTEGRLFQVI